MQKQSIRNKIYQSVFIQKLTNFRFHIIHKNKSIFGPILLRTKYRIWRIFKKCVSYHCIVYFYANLTLITEFTVFLRFNYESTTFLFQYVYCELNIVKEYNGNDMKRLLKESAKFISILDSHFPSIRLPVPVIICLFETFDAMQVLKLLTF